MVGIYVSALLHLQSGAGCTTSIEIFLHCQRGTSALLNGAIDEASPAYRPIGIGKVHVALWRPEFFQVFCDETGRRKEPSALGKFVVRPVVEYLKIIINGVAASAGGRLTTLSISIGVNCLSASIVLLMSFSG